MDVYSRIIDDAIYICLWYLISFFWTGFYLRNRIFTSIITWKQRDVQDFISLDLTGKKRLHRSYYIRLLLYS